ncbi:tryptophan-rich sensory protein [Candidatus Woesearchaeota archaeon]|nr:tryptophan-rich sensory protein [Candidatus Woesearchaeota archaeon]
MKKGYKLLISVVVCLLAGAIGSLFTAASVSTWYITLVKPSFNPPSWVFGPVWTALYIMMGIALYLVWAKAGAKGAVKGKGMKEAMKLFFTQLWLNILWSLLFFGLRNPLFALIGIVLLWLMILWTIISFYKIEKKAAYLLIPYILWVSFAAVLNFAIVLLN